jgi:hypothetical protein
MLGEVAWAIARTKDNYLSAFYHRVARRRGNEIAIMALAHKVLAGLATPRWGDCVGDCVGRCVHCTWS